jgi:hypothetical protein
MIFIIKNIFQLIVMLSKKKRFRCQVVLKSFLIKINESFFPSYQFSFVNTCNLENDIIQFKHTSQQNSLLASLLYIVYNLVLFDYYFQLSPIMTFVSHSSTSQTKYLLKNDIDTSIYSSIEYSIS